MIEVVQLLTTESLQRSRIYLNFELDYASTIIAIQWGMLTLDLFSIVFKIPEMHIRHSVSI